MSDPKYRIEQGTVEYYGEERAQYVIVRADGTPAGMGPGEDSRIWKAEFLGRETAELFMKFYENTPTGYSLRLDRSSRRSMNAGRQYWLATGGADADPSSARIQVDIGARPPEGSFWPEGTTDIDMVIHRVLQHAQGAQERIAQKAEEDAVAAAEAVTREAREEQLAQAREEKGELATPRQVEYILRLLEERKRSGEGGGFFTGPTDQAGIETLSKREASAYITSLTGDY